MCPTGSYITKVLCEANFFVLQCMLLLLLVSTNTNMADIICDETPSHPKLLGYRTVVDENTDLSHLVEPPDDGSLQWSKITAKADHPGEGDKFSKGDLINKPHLEQIEEDKILDIITNETAGKIPKGSLPYRESITSISSLESVNLEENESDTTISASSSKRSSLVSLGDIQISTDPSMSPIPEDGVCCVCSVVCVCLSVCSECVW